MSIAASQPRPGLDVRHVAGRRKVKTCWARGRWTSKCPTWTRVWPRLIQSSEARLEQPAAARISTPGRVSPLCLNRPDVTPSTSRRYKTQLRDFLSSCRTKRKANDIYAESSGFPAYPAPATAYMTGTSLAGYPSTPDTTTLYMQPANITTPAYQTLYPGVDNR